MGPLRFDGFSEYRWPLLSSVLLGGDLSRGLTARRPSRSSPPLNPRNLAAQPMAKIDRGLIHAQLGGSSPKLERVTVAAAAMAIVATARHVHRERMTPSRPGLMQRTTSVPLHPRSLRGLESQQVQNLLHRDFRANSVEVDAWHGGSSLGDGPVRCLRTVPFPFSLWGTGTIPLG
jgi:hypothetical protein